MTGADLSLAAVPEVAAAQQHRPSAPARPLVVIGHGTRSAAGVAVVREVAARAGAELGQRDVPVGFVDVCGPTAGEALSGLAQAVVVPYFLATGFHVRVDLPEALRTAPGSTATAALGVSPEVVAALVDRLREALDGTALPDAILLGAAGSSDVRARQEVHCLAAVVAAATGVRTQAGFIAGPGPTVYETLCTLREAGAERVAAASFLLAPGQFHDKLAGVGADLTTTPLGAHPALVDLVVRRYRSVVRSG